jgi:hypothetical protein
MKENRSNGIVDYCIVEARLAVSIGVHTLLERQEFSPRDNTSSDYILS